MLLGLVDDLGEVEERASEPVKSGDDEYIGFTLLELPERL